MFDIAGIKLTNLCTRYTMNERNTIVRVGAQLADMDLSTQALTELLNKKPHLKSLFPTWELLDNFRDASGKKCLTIDTFTSEGKNFFRINSQNIAVEDRNLGVFDKMLKLTKAISENSLNYKPQENCLNNFDYIGTIGFDDKTPVSQSHLDIQLAANYINTAISTTIKKVLGI